MPYTSPPVAPPHPEPLSTLPPSWAGTPPDPPRAPTDCWCRGRCRSGGRAGGARAPTGCSSRGSGRSSGSSGVGSARGERVWGPPALGTAGWEWDIQGGHLGMLGQGWSTRVGPGDTGRRQGAPRPGRWVWGGGPYSGLADGADPDLAGVAVPARQEQQEGVGAGIVDRGQAPAEAPGTDVLQGHGCHGGALVPPP